MLEFVVYGPVRLGPLVYRHKKIPDVLFLKGMDIRDAYMIRGKDY